MSTGAGYVEEGERKEPVCGNCRLPVAGGRVCGEQNLDMLVGLDVRFVFPG